MSSSSPECSSTEGHVTQLVMSSALPVGSLISYLPQFVKIIQEKSHVGVNLNCICGNSTANCCALMAFLSLHWHAITGCCGTEHSRTTCATNVLRPLQLIVMYLCSIYLVWLYLTHFDEEKQRQLGAGDTPGALWKSAKRKTALLALSACLIFGAGVIIGFVEGRQGNSAYASGLSILGSVITSVHWLPQIYETWLLGSLGSLSFWMLLLQCGGCILVFFNVKSGGMIVGIPFLLASLMMFILMCMAGYYHCVDQDPEVWNEGLHQGELQQSDTVCDSLLADGGSVGSKGGPFYSLASSPADSESGDFHSPSSSRAGSLMSAHTTPG